MGNHRIEISEGILRDFEDLVREAGVTREEFLSCVSRVYGINYCLEKDSLDYRSYYDSFIA